MLPGSPPPPPPPPPPDDDDGDAGEVEDDDDNLSDLSDVPYQSDDDGLNYDWELVGGPTGLASSKAAKADAAGFEASDGVVARVEPLWTLIRLWITVKPSRLYEGLGPAAVDALGLDPTKGVMVMLATDQLYTSSNVCPRVLWVRQVDDGDSDGDPCPDESVGSIFPLQWMLCKRLQEHLSQNWPPPLRREREPSPSPAAFPPGASSSSHPSSFSSNLSRPSSFGTTSNSGGRGGGELGAGGGGGASYFAGERQSLELEQEQGLELEEAVVVGGDGALARLLGWDCDSVEVRKAVEAVRECTGVSAELAEYALRSAKCVQQAQLNLLDDDPRASLELALQEDRRVGIAELLKELPLVDREVIEQAVIANPGSLVRQRIHVRKAQEGVILSPTPAAAAAAAATATAAAAAATAAAATAAAAGKKRGGMISWGGVGSGRSAAASTTTTTVTGGIRAAAAAAVTAASGLRASSTASSGGGGGHGGGGGGGGGSDADAGDADCGEGGGDGRRAKLSSWWRNKKLKRRGSRPSEGGNKDGEARNMGGGGRGEEGDVGSVVLAYLSPEEAREHRRAWLEHRAAANFLLQVGLFVTKKVQNANKNCLVCDDPIEGFLPAVPIVCPKELCVMSSQDMGCGTDVESQVVRKGHTVDLLIDLFWMSVEGARPELACPDMTQWESGLRINTWTAGFVHGELRRALAQFPSVTEMQLCIERKRLENGGDATHDGGSGGGSGNVPSDVSSGAGLVGVSPSGMGVGGGTVAGGGSGAGSEGRFMTLHEALLEKHPMSYHLLRWLLSANRAHLRPLDGAEIIREIPCQNQFMLVTGTAEREAKFQQMKRDAARNGGAGSFFAFHGSPADNWHGILHLGLKNMPDTKYMTSGKTYGKGIYMAEKLSVALVYAMRRSKSHWPKARTAGEAVIVAVCEVVDKKFSQWEQAEHQYFVVPEEECVATRFLLINPDVNQFGKLDVCAKDISARLTRALG